jgi:hypothetical protein
MTRSTGPVQGVGTDGLAGVGGPEKGFLIVRAGGDASPGHDAAGEAGAVSDRDVVPDGAAADPCSAADPGAAEDAVPGVEPDGSAPGEQSASSVELSAALRKRSAALERFERRAEEIARAAEVVKRAIMEDPADLLDPSVEERLPEMRHERGLAGRNASEHSRSQSAHTRVQERAWSLEAEARDTIPFGLQRRVIVRVPILREQQRCGPAGGPVAGEETGKVGADGGVGIHDQKIPAGEEIRGVAERSRRSENARLREKRELNRTRRLLAQVALDLITEVMKINCHFSDAGLLEPPKVR